MKPVVMFALCAPRGGWELSGETRRHALLRLTCYRSPLALRFACVHQNRVFPPVWAGCVRFISHRNLITVITLVFRRVGAQVEPERLTEKLKARHSPASEMIEKFRLLCCHGVAAGQRAQGRADR